MKLDKETIIAIVVCILFLFGWQIAVKKFWPVKPPVKQPVVTENEKRETPEKPSQPEKGPEETIPDSTKTVVETAPPEVKKPIKKADSVAPNVKKYPYLTLENDFLVAAIDPNKGDISSIKMKKYFTTVKDEKSLKKSDVNIVLLENVENGAFRVTSEDNNWILTGVDINVENKGTPKESVIVKRTFKTDSNQVFTVTQKWSIQANYVLQSSIEITNLSNATLTLENINLSAGGIPKITELAGDKVMREEHVFAFYDIEDGKVDTRVVEKGTGIWASLTGGGKGPKQVESYTISSKAKWVGVSDKYFSCILLPEKPFDSGLIGKGVVFKNKDKKEYVMAEAVALLNFENIVPGTSQSRNFRFYAGPKKLKLLNEFDPTASKIMKLYILGASFLEFISVGFLHMLNWLKDWCGSYGLSIILLTLIVKTVFWPITHRANVSMRKMQKIQPLIKELRKQNKDNPQQMNMEMMKLYKEHKVNPLGGCLPILMQMPVFFALYATFSGSIAPRHTSFLWMHDLSMPDTVWTIPWANLPVNPLMLMMTGTMVLQQKLTPSAADPAQQRMMMFMPLIMLVMLYSLPSGLTLYWTVSQFISIAQLVVNKQIEKRAELREAAA